MAEISPRRVEVVVGHEERKLLYAPLQRIEHMRAVRPTKLPFWLAVVGLGYSRWPWPGWIWRISSLLQHRRP